MLLLAFGLPRAQWPQLSRMISRYQHVQEVQSNTRQRHPAPLANVKPLLDNTFQPYPIITARVESFVVENHGRILLQNECTYDRQSGLPVANNLAP